MKGKMRAFTLIEAMIVLAIVGILAAIAVPAYERHKVKESCYKTGGYIEEIVSYDDWGDEHRSIRCVK